MPSSPRVRISFCRVQLVAYGALALVIGSLAGCGGTTDPFSYVQEHGKITFTDGSLLQAPRIQLIFVSETPPADPKFSPPHGIAEVNVADGTYDFITSHIQRGIEPGKHKVIIKCIDAKDHPITTLVASEYLELRSTPLEADTANPDSFNFKVKKYAGPTGPNMQGRPGMPYPGTGYPGVQGGRRQN